MEVEIISKECIKPSSPTPNHLKTHKLSLLDQYISHTYVPMVLFYPTNQDKNLNSTDIVTKRSQLLKQSLSETLTRFYPLAGQVKDNVSIDCNDEGAYYIVAQVNSPLSEFLNQPDLSLIHNFLPQKASWNESTPGSHVSMIQETTFACGGFVIGCFFSHMIVDGISLSTFLKSWAATARKSCNEAVCPNFDAPSMFPQNDAYPRNRTLIALYSPFFKTSRCATRRFVFDASAIALLKAKATSSSVPNPTRVEAVSALICKCTMAALKAKSGVQKPTLITHAVNLRRRAVPPFVESSMGNFLWMAGVLCTGGETDSELHGLVFQVREAIRKINGEFVKNLQGDGGLLKLCDVVKETGEVFSGGGDMVGFTSWCNFGLYEVDFGWGQPIWTACVGASKSETVFMNTVILMDTRSGDGIEAWIYLDEEEMAVLEHDKELLACSSLEPSPLKLGNSVTQP